MKKSFLGVSVLAVAMLGATSASYAQNAQLNAEFEKDFALMRSNLPSNKKQIIAANLPLTDVEATKFWPVYDAYVGEMTTQYDQFYAVIKEYAANQKTLTDDQAIKAVKEGLKDKAGKTLMKPAEGLTDADIKAVVAYMRTFKK